MFHRTALDWEGYYLITTDALDQKEASVVLESESGDTLLPPWRGRYTIIGTVDMDGLSPMLVANETAREAHMADCHGCDECREVTA